MENSKAIYGLIGHPLGHSFSKNFFSEKFATEGIAAEYRNFDIPHIEDFSTILTDNQVKGLNVTIPYKQAVMPLLTKIDATAEKIGAVNVVQITRVGGAVVTTGYNSDVIGFTLSIRPLLKPSHRKALILGTGGASKAVAYGLEMLGVAPTFVSRTPKTGCLTYGNLNKEVMAENTVIINTTPLGMYPDIETHPDIPYAHISPAHLCYDLTYNPSLTKFLALAQNKGATIKNGYEMLVIQALESWKTWNDSQ